MSKFTSEHNNISPCRITRARVHKVCMLYKVAADGVCIGADSMFQP